MVQFTETHVLSTQTSKGNSQEVSQQEEEPDLNQVWQLGWLPGVWQPGWRCSSGEPPSGLPPQMGPVKSMLSSKTVLIACFIVLLELTLYNDQITNHYLSCVQSGHETDN